MTIIRKYSQTIRNLTNKDDKEDGLLLTNKTEMQMTANMNIVYCYIACNLIRF
jgi:hypothetical protein